MAGTPDGHPTPDPPAADPLSNTDAEGKKLTIDNASVPTLYPLFNPDPAAVPGLELLAAAAASTEAQVTKGNNPPATHSTVIPQGPFNPAASLPMKVVKKILDLEFIEMSEVTIDDDITGPGRPAAPVRLPVTDISQWLERYSLMAATILTTRFPEKAPERFAYQLQTLGGLGSVGSLLWRGRLEGRRHTS